MKIQHLSHTYDRLSTEYEAQCGEFNKYFEGILVETTSLLPNRSKILDVGSGPGTPVAFHFANKGHSVTGIDISPGMIEIARRKVPQASFIKVDSMTAYQPPQLEEYDAIVASQSLYHLSLAQLRSMMYKFSQWLKKEGLFILAHSIHEDLVKNDKIIFDYRGWSEVSSGDFLGEPMEMIFGQPAAWKKLVADAGFDILRGEEKYGEISHEGFTFGFTGIYIVARKTADNPLLGPFPLPEIMEPLPLTANNSPSWKEIFHRLNWEGIPEVKNTFQGSRYKNVLCLGNGGAIYDTINAYSENVKSIDLEGLAHYTERSAILPLIDDAVNLVISFWAMSFFLSPDKLLQDIIRASQRSERLSTVMIIQGAPDCEFINVINDAFAGPEISKCKKGLHHEGSLLRTAEIMLKDAGFTDISFLRLPLSMKLADLRADRTNHFAALLSSIWHNNIGSDLEAALKEQFQQLLEGVFDTSPDLIGYQSVLLVAKRK